MSISVTVNESEYRKMQSNFRRLRSQFSPQEIRKALIKGAPPTVATIQASAPYRTGALRKAIGVIAYLGSRTGSLFIGVRKDRGAKKIVAFYGSFLEFGTRYIPKGKFSFFEKAARQGMEISKSILLTEFTRLINKYK
jgi:HK97 gp10 family phage protein